ncbi:amino acid ABC transporter substrate-binding protein [Streptomyces fulvoviolaceus]|uniref:amino acid ABC transporter substrate-binding protein n=1 Tax=Streptomyces fulvoviolaceus TaxID=285535 RepID=UPI0006948580|nr:amino acid ABC transporter substrate-binding protein [Streptomyces fulvoviolaceus]
MGGADGLSRREFTTVGLGLGLAALVGCSGEGSAGGGDEDELVIGASLPLTGQFSQPGQEAGRGYRIWREMVNADGGILGRKVQLKITDDASSQDTVVSDYTRLITQDRVDFLLGTFSSLLNYPASAVAERQGMVFVEPAGGAENIFTRGFDHLFFAQPALSADQANTFVDWVKSLPAAERPTSAAYTTQDDPFTRPVIERLQGLLEDLGIRTVYTSVYPAETTNMQPIAAAIAGKKPELLAQGAVFQDGVGLVRALKQQDFSPKAFFQMSAPSNAGQYSKGVGTANTEGVFYSVSWHESAPTPLNKEFVTAYAKEYDNAVPAEDAADAFAAAQVLRAGIEGAKGTDQDKVAEWLHANEVETILGPLKWDKRGAPLGSFLLAQWQGGKVQIVSPEDAATTKTVIYPKPGWS